MSKKYLLISILLYLFLNSCSKQSLIKMTVKTPKVDYKKTNGFNSFSDFQKDAIYTVEIIKETYPKLYTKIPDFDEKSKQFIEKVSQTLSEKEFDIILKKFISILNDGHSNYSIDFNKYDKTKYGLYLYKEKENCSIIRNFYKNSVY